MKNYKLLDETLEYIETYPEEWDQTDFTNYCGTTFCFAGRAAILAHPDWYLEVHDRVDVCTQQRDIFTTGQMLDSTRTKRMGHLADIATEALGLDEWETPNLYSADNSLADLRNIIDEWKEQDGVA